MRSRIGCTLVAGIFILGAWTIVQWQDSAGGWHDVEGWRGTLDGPTLKRWWVADKDFGTGPFRWVVIQEPSAAPPHISEPFSLPHEANQIIHLLFNKKHFSAINSVSTFRNYDQSRLCQRT